MRPWRLQKKTGVTNSTTAWAIDFLAVLLFQRGDCAAAEPLFRQALEARERTLGKEHPDTIGSANNLVKLLMQKRDYSGAEPLLRRVLEAR